MKQALINAKIFTSSGLLEHHAIVIDKEKIRAILPESQIPENIKTIDLGGNILTSGFVDFQLYGGSNSFFVKELSFESLEDLVNTHLQDGTTSIVPTLYSTSLERILKAIEIVKAWIASGRSGIAGLHIEGPYLNLEKRGAHSEKVVRQPTATELIQIIEASQGLTTVMTIAPEVWPDNLLRMVEESHLILSLGHSNATYAQCQQYFKNIGLVTHLYNAMRPYESREVGVVGAVLDHSKVCASIIVDGFHCDFAAVRIAKNLMQERLFLISDASFARPKFKRFEFEGFTANFDGKRIINDEGKLAGSAITLLDAVKNCVQKVGISLEETFRMASLYPAKHLGLDHKLGKIKAGCQADFVLLNSNLELLKVWKNGKTI